MARRLLPAVLAVLSSAVFAEPGYFRFPGTDGRQVVFTAEGDIWRAPISGGTAQRLTTHPMQETNALLSPDGTQLVFSANYDGNTELYVMPLAGGAPQRLTFDNNRAVALGWINAAELLYTTHTERGPARTQVIARININHKTRDVLPLADANEACLADDGKSLFFTRFGLHMTGDNARQYRGGAMAQLWRFEVGGNKEAVRLAADANVPMRRPMCAGERVYYVSDADGVDNLWSMKRDGSDRKQHTRHDSFAMQSATIGNDQIVYQLGADLRRFDIKQQKDQAIALQLVSDFEQQQERWVKPNRFISQFALSPSGERVSVTARGQTVIASVASERRVEISLADSARVYDSVMSVDGKWLYAISDLSGEMEIWQFASDGSGERKQLTTDGATQRWKLRLSPNGKYIAHDDKRGRLWLLELSSGRNEKIDDGHAGGVTEYDDIVWSPDSRTLALTRANSERALPQILLYNLDSKQLQQLTSDRYESFSPAFSRDGQWLYFLSNRTFNADPGAPWGDRNMGPAFGKRSKIYAFALQDGLRFPFAAKNELIGDKKEEKKDEKKDDKKDDKKDGDKKEEKLAIIHWVGLAERLYEVPLAAGNYGNLSADDKRLYYLEQDDSDRRKQNVKTLEIGNDDSKPETFTGDVGFYALSLNGKKVLFAKVTDGVPSAFYVVDTGGKAPSELNKSQLRIADWMLAVKPAQEWRQMYVDAWRMHRDYLFDQDMRGVNWKAMRKKYEVLLPRVTDRAELDDVLAQLVAEVSTLHSQVRGGEWREDADAPRLGYLGAVLRRQNNGYRIEHIYQTESELPSERAPLLQPGVDAKIGDVISAVNGRDVSSVADISELLKNRVGQQLLLQLKRGEQTLKTVVVPVDGQRHAALRYSDWEESLRQKVDAVGKGKIGYLHLRAMGPNDIATFAREFYANFDRDGLIIDVRRNGGGNIDAWIIEKLMKRAWAYWHAADTHPYWNQQQTFRGHLVVLADQFTYSDGETFTAGIRALNLAPVIGTRTAGAGVWLSDRNRLVDGGMMRAAEFAQYSADGRWLIEGRGVSPDIEVDNLPFATFNGGDAQLGAALDYLQKKMQEKPVKQPVNSAITPVGKAAKDIR